MAYNETGHARNVASFDEMITVIKSIDKAYKPIMPAHQLSNLEFVKTQLQQNLQNVNTKQANYKDKIYARQNAYEKMSAFGTRVVAMMTAIGVEAKILTQAKAILGKIRGGGSKKKTDASETTDVAVKKNSVSQMSFDQRKHNFSILLSLASSQSAYQPTEEEIKVITLQNYLNSLQILNEEANKAEQELVMARQQRDEVLYKENTGAIALALQIKAYVKAAMGVKSNEYERIKGVKFNTIKNI
jgi:hypothetical protein